MACNDVPTHFDSIVVALIHYESFGLVLSGFDLLLLAFTHFDSIRLVFILCT